MKVADPMLARSAGPQVRTPSPAENTAGPHSAAATSPAGQLAGHAIEAGISSITATNELLRGFQAHFFAQLQSMSGQMRAARAVAQSLRGEGAASAPASSRGADAANGGAADAATASDRADATEGVGPRVRVETWMESTLQHWECGAGGAQAGSRSEAAGFAFETSCADATGATPALGQHDARPARAVAAPSQPIARRLFTGPAVQEHVPAATAASSPEPSGAATTPRSGDAEPLSVFESVMREAEKQRAAAHALLASSASTRSGTPAWVANLSENSNPNSLSPVGHLASGLPAEAHGSPVDTALQQPLQSNAVCNEGGSARADQPGLTSLQQNLADAAHTQRDLVGALQAEFAATSERVAAAGLELNALQAELEMLREQVRPHQCLLCKAGHRDWAAPISSPAQQRKIEQLFPVQTASEQASLGVVTQERDHAAAELAHARTELAALARRGGAHASGLMAAEGPPSLVGVSDSFGAATTQIPAWMGNSVATGNHPDVLPSRQSPTPKSPLSERDTPCAFASRGADHESQVQNAGSDEADEVLQCTPSPLRPAEQPCSAGATRTRGAPDAGGAAMAAPDSAQVLQAPRCASPVADSPRTSRWDPDRVHVHVDAHELRTFLAEWKGRQLHGAPPAKLRIMSQCVSACRCSYRSISASQHCLSFYHRNLLSVPRVL